MKIFVAAKICPCEVFENIKSAKLAHANFENKWSTKVNLPKVMDINITSGNGN